MLLGAVDMLLKTTKCRIDSKKRLPDHLERMQSQFVRDGKAVRLLDKRIVALGFQTMHARG